MNHQSACAVAEVIQTRAEHCAEVLNVLCEVTWPDGSTVGLHPVRQAGELPTFLRAFHLNGHWTLIDLRQFIPRQVEDIKRAQPRDQVGLVLYALRSTFVNLQAFLAHLAKVEGRTLDRWPGTPRPMAAKPASHTPQPLAGALRYHALSLPQEG